LAWAEFVRQADPDILTGYNVQNFDVPYLLNRAKALRIDNQFEHLGRVLGVKVGGWVARPPAG
jgi:DNA polymerase delta subunit 1